MSDVNRVGAGVPAGGEFAAHTRSEADVELGGRTIRLPIVASAAIVNSGPLQAIYPSTLPPATVGFDELPEGLATTFTVGEHTGWVVTESTGSPHIRFNRGEPGGWASEPTGWTAEQTEGFVDWIAEVHDRTRTNVQSVRAAALTESVSAAIAASVTGADDSTVAALARGHASESNGPLTADAAISRANQLLAAFGDADEPASTQMQDVITDLRHWAHANPDAMDRDFHDMLVSAEAVFDDELNEMEDDDEMDGLPTPTKHWAHEKPGVWGAFRN